MNKKILLFFTLLITFSVNAQVDSFAIKSLEIKLTKQIAKQEVNFNEELVEIRALQNNRLESTLKELSAITKSNKIMILINFKILFSILIGFNKLG